MKFFEFNPSAYLEQKLQVSIKRVLDSGQFVGSTELVRFEEDFGDYLGIDHTVGCGNGFDAIRLSLRALGIRPNSKVAVPSHTFFATWLAVLEVGAIPVGIDVELQTGQMSVADLTNHIDEIDAVMVVHMHGIAAPIEEICTLARSRNVPVIEDCAQSHGLRTPSGAMVGTLGDVNAFSFYPTKNLPSFGDAGAVVTASLGLSQTARAMGNYGWEKDRYDHQIPGFNSRLDEVQAAYLGVMLRELETMNLRRAQIADRYIEALGPISSQVVLGSGTNNVWHHFNLRCKDRVRIQDLLSNQHIPTNVYYPIPCHKQKSLLRYPQMNFSHSSIYSLRNAETLSSELLAIPLNQWMSEEEIEKVCCGLDSIRNEFES